MYLWLPPDTPSRERGGVSPTSPRYSGFAPLPRRCRVTPRQGPGTGFTFSCVHLRSAGHASRTLRSMDTRCVSTELALGRVAKGGYPPPALTEPDLCLSHPAPRGEGLLLPSTGRVTTSPYPHGRASCWPLRIGATGGLCLSRHRSLSETSPRSAKYALRSPRSTAGSWLRFHRDFRP